MNAAPANGDDPFGTSANAFQPHYITISRPIAQTVIKKSSAMKGAFSLIPLGPGSSPSGMRNIGITAAVDGSPSVKRRSHCSRLSSIQGDGDHCSRLLISLRIFGVLGSIEFSRMCIYIGPAVRQVDHS